MPQAASPPSSPRTILTTPLVMLRPPYQQPSHGAPRELCAVGEGVVRVVHHIVFARPNVFLILDDVETKQPAEIQFLLHALHAFQIDKLQRVVTIVNGPAAARIHLLEPGSVELSQTDQFSVPPSMSRLAMTM